MTEFSNKLAAYVAAIVNGLRTLIALGFLIILIVLLLRAVLGLPLAVFPRMEPQALAYAAGAFWLVSKGAQ
jgi:hypothetical protein